MREGNVDMGRFATTVGLYEQFRPPYPPEFFRNVAARLKLSSEQALIDLGTGPALLALGFAPYVGRVVGVDPEPRMLTAARERIVRAGRHVDLIEGRAEDLPDDIGRFDLVSIGRALHWMDRDLLRPVLERLVTPDGAIAVCASGSVRDGRNAWLITYNEARRAWSDERLWADSRQGGRVHRDLGFALEGTSFQVGETIQVETTHELSVADLARRILTFSSSSPAALGDKIDAMIADIEARLKPFSEDGVLTEIVVSTAQVARC
jgi:SAM-dependent methyltransferase